MSPKLRHILILVPGFLSDSKDLSTVPYLRNFLHDFQKSNTEFYLSIVAFHYPYDKAEYTWNNIDIYAMGGNNAKFPFKMYLWSTIVKKCSSIHMNRKVDAIQSFWMSECALLGNYLAKKWEIPHYSTAMGQDVLDSNWYLKWVLKPNSISSIFALSSDHKKCLQTKTNKEIQVVPFGISKDLVPEVCEQREVDILGVGSLIKIKNYNLFIELIKEIKTSYPTIKVKLIGEGEERQSLEKKVERIGLSKNIEFTGHLNHNEVVNEMNNARVLLHTSSFEGMGYVLAEALYMGMNVVSTPIGHRVEHKRWIVGEGKNQLIKALTDCLENNVQPERVEIQKMSETINAYLTNWRKA